jgi:tetratricopeptide (TPR) repeat protein
MGVLCVADDLELDRVVAYKVMKPGREHDPSAKNRFFQEAEITAKLVHPGIVPVFGRVTDDTGLPAYATEYVSGHTLAAAIERLHALGFDDLKARAAGRIALIRAFLSTCQIVAYAHSQDVVHGDIKPLNIMIDDFGATRLVDWGVAQFSDPLESMSPAPGPRKPRLGTPSFMSSYDTPATFASDIYSLGLTLTWILARGPEPGSKPLRPAPDSPPALWAVAHRATSDDHAIRYQSAVDLAQEVQDVLDDQPIATFADPIPTRIRRWMARHRPVVAATLSLLVVASVVGPITGARERFLRQSAEEQRLRAVELTGEMLDQAEFVGKFQATLPGSKALLDRAVRLIDQLAHDVESRGENFRPAVANYYRAGLIHLNLNQLSEAAECFRKSIGLAERAFQAHPDDFENRNLWASALRDWGVSRFAAGDHFEAARAWSKALEILEPIADGSADYRLTLVRTHFAIGNLAMLSGQQPSAQASYRRALELATDLVQTSPDAPRFLKALADVQSNRGMSLQKEASPDGQRLTDPGKLDEAVTAHRQALIHRRRLIRLEPGKPEYLSDVAASLNHLGNAALSRSQTGYAEAEGFYREALSILEALAIAYPGVPSNRSEVAMVYSNLNVLLTRQHRSDEVRTLARSAVDLFGKLVEDYPDTPELQIELGVALEQLAANLGQGGRNAEADDDLYLSAIAYARSAALTREPKQRENLVRKTLMILGSLDSAGYFQKPDRAKKFQNERGFDHLRKQPGFP